MSSSTGTTSTTTPPSGNGTSIESPAWSLGIINDPSAHPQYIVDDNVSSPRFVRVTLSEARAHQDLGKKVYYATTHLLVPKGTLPPAPTGTSGQAFESRSQNQEIAGAENVVSTSGGDLAQAYNASQIHHGDALADSDRENTGDSSEEGDESTSSSGAASSN